MKQGLLLSLLLILVACTCLPGRPARADESGSDGAANSPDAAPPKLESDLAAVPDALTTDHQTAEREAESISRSRARGEKFEFQAEVSRLMDIIINSLYSNKDIFLRELISNASDALDKIRFLSLTDKNVLGEGDTAKLEIQIKLDKDRNILIIRDRGIGMTKEDLIKNLGTIAKSGTSAFLEQMQKGGDLNLIGQFGVGFYSVYLVADKVEVISKHNDDKQYIWESKADGGFTVLEDTEGEALGRGTEIRIHLKDDSLEYGDEQKLKELVKRYSEFINFPIYMWASKEVDKEVPVEDEEATEVDEGEEAEAKDKSDEAADEGEEEEGEGADSKSKTKSVKETVWEWELLNDVKAIWLRNPKDISEDDYVKFYQSMAKDVSGDKPLSWTHFNAEGDVEFKAVLYIPPRAPYDLYDNYYSTKPALKLYVRRVFISDEFDELLPKYLSFIKGLVDSDTLPLNVSREMLQQHGSLKTIKKKLIRKVLDMIRKIAEEDEDERKKMDEEEAEAEKKNEESKSDSKGKYGKFWKEFGKAMKLGVIEDPSNRVRLAKLLRFHSSKSGDKLTSLEEYVSRMKKGQKQIYYLTGQSKDQLEKSPFLEKLLKKGYEVFYFTDPLDEYLMQNLTEFDDKKFQDASKEDLKLGEKGTAQKKKEKAVREEFKKLTTWWKDLLGEKSVESVKVSNRLSETPCVVVTSKFGWSANMERIMKAQALSDESKQSYMKGRRTLEINPRHPLVKQLKEKVAEDPDDVNAKASARLMFDAALLESGFLLEEPKDFAARFYDVLKKTLDVDPDATVEPDDEPAEQEETTSGNEEDSASKDKRDPADEESTEPAEEQQAAEPEAEAEGDADDDESAVKDEL
ncbi:hypothetical protein CBR_g34543 [Chara braunii]|uniref:Endoplasmin homolog n=1 Tax=Chara braunii TaxID=69332 RepID=A0A388LIU8_CHABU|nr:hypothetical protein CBR_g34543 [Chara braunii]|eukprot:GBG82260.1 hypothetical protein CBR_g34543 [Chara braunii]